MLQYILIIIWCLSMQIIEAQNLIKNAGFESLTRPDFDYNCAPNDISQCRPFKLNRVNDWKNYVETPEIKLAYAYSGNSCGKFTLKQQSGSITFQEGIFQDGLNLTPNKVYIVSVRYKATGNASLEMYASNNLVHNDDNVNILSPNKDFIGHTPVDPNPNNPQWYLFNTTYIPSSTFTQIALYSAYDHVESGYSEGTIYIDEVIVKESCCAANQTYQNITNPPSINVQQNIECNTNVSFSNSNTSLEAGNGITLSNNVTINGVQSFTLSSRNCIARQVELYVNIEQIECNFKLTASACYGSGLFEFYFNDVVSSDGVLSQSITNSNNVVVKVKDIVTNTIVSKTIILPTPKYTGSFTYTNVSNAISPNGDGINDTWKLIDGGKTTFAYNAFAWKMVLTNRWGSSETILSKPVGSNGFDENSTIWNAQFQGSTFCNATMFYQFYLKNCTYDQIASGNASLVGSITSVCSSALSKTSVTEMVEELMTDKKSDISPNPSTGNLILNIYNTNEEQQITIFLLDVLGKSIPVNSLLQDSKKNKKTFMLDCSNLPEGIYFCQIQKLNSQEIIKFSLIR